MYIVDYDILISQLLPPHWRGQWQENLVRSCCEPMKGIYEDFRNYIWSLPEEINLNAQILIMETYLNRIAGYNDLNRISITDGPNTGQFIINIPADSDCKHLVKAYCDRFRLGGMDYTLNEY